MVAGLFGGCAAQEENPEVYVPTGDALLMEDEKEEDTVQTDEAQQLTLAYYSSKSMNPLKATNYTNRALLPLIYQGLFAVDREYKVEPILCKSYTVTADLMTYEFVIDPDATFSDGAKVKAKDVVASLKAAMKSSYYGGRLRYVQKISQNDAGNVEIKLKQAYENLPLLLDIPIVKKSQLDEKRPLGSGPYILHVGDDGRYLQKRQDWWCKSKDLLITAERIPLRTAKTITDIRDYFEFEDVGLVCTDPSSDRYAEYRCDYELWDCETGMFLFLGVNKESSVLKKKAVRQAISRGIDRERLADSYYRDFAVAATLPASPNSPYYTATLAQKYGYNKDTFLSKMKENGVSGKTVKLLVNSDDSLRVKVAEEIGRMLSSCGLIVDVVSKSSSAYRTALAEGKYDLYLGQTKLSANMDLTPFFSDSGALSYGGMADISTYNLCLQALENSGNYYTLHETIMKDGYLCPVLFLNYAVYATRGLLTQLQPARDNLFFYTIEREVPQE
jgi:peptide/nickel transport system substrate-binding protein